MQLASLMGTSMFMSATLTLHAACAAILMRKSACSSGRARDAQKQQRMQGVSLGWSAMRFGVSSAALPTRVVPWLSWTRAVPEDARGADTVSFVEEATNRKACVLQLLKLHIL